MSRRPSRVTIGSAEVLEIIREEMSATTSSLNIDDANEKGENEPGECPCQALLQEDIEKRHAEEIKRLLSEKEREMEEKFKKKLENEIQYLKDKFGFVLQNEQVRASYMLREAHRERQEKITALQTQLECKNLAGLMYVMCCERRKNKMEMLRLSEEYTNYIQTLQNILEESQALILNLSRGYKTAARVDNEWRWKMKKIMQHFQSFVFEFMGGSPETNQYFFDIPALLKTEASVKDNPEEDPCEVEEETENMIEPEKGWWETLDCEEHPFVVFGDMAEFLPPQRREVIQNIKAAKTAPRKWKEYVFNDMFLKRTCPNADLVKEMSLTPGYWECAVTTARQTSSRCSEIHSRRVTTASADFRGNMGSILKIVTSTNPQSTTKATLLGARDSMEIASTTKLREKHRSTVDHGRVVINVGNKIDSFFNEIEAEAGESDGDAPAEPTFPAPPRNSKDDGNDDDNGEESLSNLGSTHHDSLQIIPSHVPDHDSKINYERVCPMEKCQKMHMDSFIRSLPKYMRENPFTHFEQTYDEYEACSPEQLEILKSRIEEKRKKEKVDFLEETDPLLSWTPSVEGVEVQTSDISLLPPCTCLAPSPSPASSDMRVYNVADLIPIKHALDKINTECFFHDKIEFNRFKVIGQNDSDDDVIYGRVKESSKNRLDEIKRILKQHPSLYEIFQANTQC